MLSSLFKNFDNIIVLDVETTGIEVRQEEIIELGALRLTQRQGRPVVEEEFNHLIQLSAGKRLPAQITELTGITEGELIEQGLPKEEVSARFAEMLDCESPLLVAYNAQFDLCFLYYFLNQFGWAALLKKVKMLDALTVYKDRRSYPHRLENAVAAYSLHTQNTHRAIDDAKATLELLEAMEGECDDLKHYVNLFGFNPKYGISGPKISSVRYLPQAYNQSQKLYER